jgi:hypothetical protein
MKRGQASEIGVDESTCATCGIPLDAQQFDESGVALLPEGGRSVGVARFELPPQYCGVLQYFSQFFSRYEQDKTRVETPGLLWLILANGRPLYPYTKLERIVNPWGYGSFPISIRLDDGATLEFVVRNVNYAHPAGEDAPVHVGGRIVGRFWYNRAFGDVGQRRF